MTRAKGSLYAKGDFFSPLWNLKIVYLLVSMVELRKLVRIVEMRTEFKTKIAIKNIVMSYVVLLIRTLNELRKKLNGKRQITRRLLCSITRSRSLIVPAEGDRKDVQHDCQERHGQHHVPNPAQE